MLHELGLSLLDAGIVVCVCVYIYIYIYNLQAHGVYELCLLGVTSLNLVRFVTCPIHAELGFNLAGAVTKGVFES